MLDTVKNRLSNMNYEFMENDDFIINFLIEKVDTSIKTFCNIPSIPDELKSVKVDMVTALFLQEKKASNVETLLGLDVTQAVQSIREGDTSITFAIGNGNYTPSQKIDNLIDYLINESEKILLSYRCLSW